MTGILKKILQRKKITLTALVLILVLFFAFHAMAKGQSPQEVRNNSLTVEVMEAKKTDFHSGITYKAELEPAEQAVISSGAPGQVTRVLFENGDQVTKGQPLAYLDTTDLERQREAAEVDLASLQLQLTSMQRNYATAKELYENGALSRNAYEDAELAYQTFLSNTKLKKIQIQSISDLLNDCIITASISGEISSKTISLGQYVAQGTSIATVKNNTSIKALIRLSQSDLEKVSVGQGVSLKLLEGGSSPISGTVETLAASADSQSRTFDCLLRFDNSDRALNAGVYGYVDLNAGEARRALTVPLEALAGTEGNYAVFIAQDSSASKVTVTVGEISDDTAEITSGIQEGDQIILTNLSSLHNGDKIKVREGK